MERNSFNSIVISYFDEIKDKYMNDVRNEWGGEEIGSTILIEDYLLPYVYDNLDDLNVMNKLSNLLEKLISLNDDYCEEVLYSSFFEKIHYDDVEDRFLDYYKAKTREFYYKLKY